MHVQLSVLPEEMHSGRRAIPGEDYHDTFKARPKVILCVAASDAHVVGNHMIAMFLRDNGIEVVNLGAATPIEEIMEAWQLNQDAIAIVIGSLNGHAVDDLAGLGVAKRDYQVRCPVFLGGNLSVGSQKTRNEAERLLQDGVTEIVTDPERLLARLQALVTTRAELH